jgi:glycosyltransferase involved in cell wall biosynthesis
MHIVIVYPGVIPVVRYGGTGRDIWYEGKELTRLGHKVTYLTGAGSSCPFGDVVPILPGKTWDEQIPESADLVHFHFTPRQQVRKPYLVTIHGNGMPGEEFDINTVFVSSNHATRHGSEVFVYNGMDWDDYGPVKFDNQRGYFHFLGNAAWRVKNLKGAIRVTGAAGERLHVLGGTRINFRMGFSISLARHVKYYGFVGGEEKLKALQGSRGLIFPVLWYEPMGLAIIESLYFGSPVFGTPYGSLPELVPAEVGYLTNSASSMAEAVANADLFSAKACHEYARDQFNSRRMTSAYILLFEKVLNGESLNLSHPKASGQPAPGLLPWLE